VQSSRLAGCAASARAIAYCYRTIPQTLFQLRAQPPYYSSLAGDIYSSMPTYSLKGSCAAPSARRHRMKELTLSQILDEAFERSRDLDAPLQRRLESFADSVASQPGFAEVVDGLSRGSISMARRRGSRCRDPMPPSCCPTIKASRHPRTTPRQRPWRCPSPRALVPILPAQYKCSSSSATRRRTHRRVRLSPSRPTCNTSQPR